MIEPVQSSDELIDDFHGADNVTGAIHIWRLGQNSFLIKWNGFGLLMDPYLTDSLTRKRDGSTPPPFTAASPPVVDPHRLSGVDLVTCCNAHPDHLDPETLMALRAASPSMKVVMPKGVVTGAESEMGPACPPIVPINTGTYVKAGPFQVHALPAANPDLPDDGGEDSHSVCYVISFGQFIIFHAGDTTWHKTLIREVRRWPINLAFLPINGRDGVCEFGYNMNGFESAAFAKSVSASLAIPCHYDMFLEDNVTTEEFESCCERLHQRYRVMELGQRMTMGPLTDPSAGKGQGTSEYRDLGY